MADSFGDDFTIVEVTPDNGSEQQTWLALAKPGQAVTLVLAAVPEGWMAGIIPASITRRQRKLFNEAHLEPGGVLRIS